MPLTAKSDFKGLARPSQDLKIPFKTLKLAYFYLKHAQIARKYILKQVLSEGSTAQNARKVLKIAKITKITKIAIVPTPCRPTFSIFL